MADDPQGTTVIDCAAVRDGELIDRYLDQRLTEAEAEAFEAHYFACRDCWRAVDAAMLLRASAPAGEGTPPRLTPARSPSRWGRWSALAAAAVVVVVVGTQWRTRGPDPETTIPVVRGSDATIVVEGAADGAGLTAAWEPVPEADRYRVRLYDPTGNTVVEAEVTESRIEVSRDVLTASVTFRTLYWQVEALDPLRRVMARSRLTRTSPAN